ncbi:MAG: phosphoglycerate mutase [Arcobacter sp.]|uniref:SixA phosphatase family protein n=1 Tax=uncultured Arcobacter sp. TaxID=165434 RepID=UPI000CBF38DB|nr:histidine phosphatase family protein [uncultured Arcobacter sp.]PLY10304.1 MAG: phosphoglycerate mutase [Arcobacter sp.]
MKTLYIMRHPQKQVAKPNQDDFDIKLSQEGIEEAKRIAQNLSSLNIKPDLIVASPANRTRETAEIVSEILKYDKNIMYNEVLFQAYVNELIETISYTFDTVNEMFLIGHNPSLTALTITLDVYREEIKPGEVLKVEFETNSWIDIGKENAKFIWIEKPDYNNFLKI